MTLTPRLSNSGFRPATVPSSVVHTGVKSRGCENSTAQLPSFHFRNESMCPSVVSAEKSGTTSPSRNAMSVSLGDFECDDDFDADTTSVGCRNFLRQQPLDFGGHLFFAFRVNRARGHAGKTRVNRPNTPVAAQHEGRRERVQVLGL